MLATARFLCTLTIFSALLNGQTFRGAIVGTVSDQSGALVPKCQVKAQHAGSGLQWSATTSGAGRFALPELPTGNYELTAGCPGFANRKLVGVPVAVSVSVTLNLTVEPEAQSNAIVIEAPPESLETASSSRNIVIGSQLVQNLPLNGRDFLRLLRLSPGVVLQGTSFYAVNGNRGRSNNFQIDGADNNDAWQNASAGNQGGVSAVPNTLVPIESIDEFALQSIGNSEQGRNSGANVNLVLRSGTNQIHGAAFYFNRNEALSANSPIAPAGSPKRKIRNHQYGFSLGGPVIRNRTFFFSAFEGQRIRIGNALLATTPSDAWVARGRGVLSVFSVPENPVSRRLLSFWPQTGRGAAALANNFFSNQDNDYLTDNGVLKLDHHINQRQNLSIRYFGATGSQTAFVSSPYREYFQVATSRLHNYALALTSSISTSDVNQLVLGVNYFKPTFNDADLSANPVALGLNTGVLDPSLRGAPTITLSGFAGVGPTQPQGRVDATWHISDTLSAARGRHLWKFGGEVRVARLDIFNETNKRGSFNFDGSAGPWATGTPEERALGSTFSPPERVLADLLGGFVSPNSGARITRGNLARDLRQRSWDFFAHDSWQLTRTLNINYGIRYSYLGVLRDTANTLSTFLPGAGIVTPGTAGLESLYPSDRNNFAPRIGFAWQPSTQSRWTVRAGYGFYYDVFHMTYFASNTPSNSGAAGVHANPGGAEPVFNLARGGFRIADGEPIFGSVNPAPPFGAYSVSQDLRTPYVQNYHFTLQRQLGAKASAQVAYVGSSGRKLPLTRNVNAPLPDTIGTLQSRRPYGTLHPLLGTINELQSIGNSSYNSLQTVVNVTAAAGLYLRIAYTYSKVLDYGSDARFIIPANSYDLRRERGPADFDARHVFVAGASYEVPHVQGIPRAIGGGWSLHSFVTAHTGLPLDIRAGTNVSNSFDGADRVDLVGDPAAGIVQPAGATTRRFFNPAAFARPTVGSFGNIGRNVLTGPGFGAVDISLFKRIRLAERWSAEFRTEAFNLFNRTNWAPPGTSLASSTNFGLMTNTRNGGSAPGIGPGEPRSIQLALKMLF